MSFEYIENYCPEILSIRALYMNLLSISLRGIVMDIMLSISLRGIVMDIISSWKAALLFVPLVYDFVKYEN